MNTLKISKANSLKEDAAGRRLSVPAKPNSQGYILVMILLFVMASGQYLVMGFDPTIGFIDPNIWLLILLSLISFLVMTGLCWWLLQKSWRRLGLPALGNMVLQFKELTLWQQLGSYLFCFVSLLLAAVGVLNAIL